MENDKLTKKSLTFSRNTRKLEEKIKGVILMFDNRQDCRKNSKDVILIHKEM